jgi:hypothetical protein
MGGRPKKVCDCSNPTQGDRVCPRPLAVPLGRPYRVAGQSRLDYFLKYKRRSFTRRRGTQLYWDALLSSFRWVGFTREDFVCRQNSAELNIRLGVGFRFALPNLQLLSDHITPCRRRISVPGLGLWVFRRNNPSPL